jgi:hypothetical protein
MTIDLSQWNEYVNDDVLPGPIPFGDELEAMQIITGFGYKKESEEGLPSAIKLIDSTVSCKLYWRLKVVEDSDETIVIAEDSKEKMIEIMEAE